MLSSWTSHVGDAKLEVWDEGEVKKELGTKIMPYISKGVVNQGIPTSWQLTNLGQNSAPVSTGND